MGVAFAVGAAIVVSVLFGLIAFFAGDAKAAEVQIPAPRFSIGRRSFERLGPWGLNAPVSVFAAQIHTESWWRNDTVSGAGAQGLAQFMPSTARWLPTLRRKSASRSRSIPRGRSERASITINPKFHNLSNLPFLFHLPHYHSIQIQPFYPLFYHLSLSTLPLSLIFHPLQS